MNTTQRQTEDEDAFWRKLVLPQEDRMRLGIPWQGGYRWFKSTNVVPIEQGRKRKESPSRPDEKPSPQSSMSEDKKCLLQRYPISAIRGRLLCGHACARPCSVARPILGQAIVVQGKVAYMWTRVTPTGSENGPKRARN
jgi:hypothetical protein